MARPTAGAGTTDRVRLRADERRAQLARVAARHFHRLGYHQVSLAEVASSVGLTAPAIYRHFENKQGLLAAAITSGLDVVDAAFDAAAQAPLDELLASLAGVAAERRDLWMLLQRELRNLDPALRSPIEVRFAAFIARFRDHVAHARPRERHGDLALITTATLAVLSSPSMYPARQVAEVKPGVLAAAAGAVAHAALPTAGPEASTTPAPPGAASTVARRDELLETAIALFHDHGYAAVSLDDIAAAAGMTGPSIYHYFATKADLLIDAFTRATSSLADQRAHGAAASLDDLVAAYVELGVRERLVLGVYALEAVYLPPEAGRRIRDALDDDVRAWATALGRQRPELPGDTRLILARAARAVVHDVVRIGNLHARDAIRAELRVLVKAVLDADVLSP